MPTWMEIFAGGQQVDSLGRPHDGDSMIEKALASFNADHHKPPIVIGHPAEDAPAYGWVTALRTAERAGRKILEAQVDHVAPELTELVRAGRYQTRSASFYPDGSLRHVGFLGAQPPAVKGLSTVRFSSPADEATTFDFSGDNPGNQQGVKSMLDEIKSFLGLTKELGWGPIPVSPVTDPPKADGIKTFSEAEMEAVKTQAIADALAQAKSEADAAFAEREAALAKDKRNLEIKAMVDKGVADGVIPPAFADAGLVAMFQVIDTAGPVNFADKQVGPVDAFMALFEMAKKQSLFAETATRANVTPEFAEAKQEQELASKLAAIANARAGYKSGK